MSVSYTHLNLEVELLENEYKEVVALIKYLRSILGSETKLLEVIKEELTAIKDKYADKRRTQLMKEEHAQIEVDESESVSYTHLDVYKRQISRWAARRDRRQILQSTRRGSLTSKIR